MEKNKTDAEVREMKVSVRIGDLFSEAELRCIRRAIDRVWSDCAYDLLQAVAEEKGKSVDAVTIPRSHVIEIALDAGRPEEHLKRDKDFSAKSLEAWDICPYVVKLAIAKTVFTYTSYGT